MGGNASCYDTCLHFIVQKASAGSYFCRSAPCNNDNPSPANSMLHHILCVILYTSCMQVYAVHVRLQQLHTLAVLIYVSVPVCQGCQCARGRSSDNGFTYLDWRQPSALTTSCIRWLQVFTLLAWKGIFLYWLFGTCGPSTRRELGQ